MNQSMSGHDVSMRLHPFNRMLLRQEFDAVFQKPCKKVHGTGFLMLAKQVSDHSNKLGLVVGKKNMPKAVARNRFKRQVRESFRHHKQSNLHVIVLAKRTELGCSPRDFRQSLDKAFETVIDALKL